MVEELRRGGSWTALADEPAAARSAAAGNLVVAGLKGSEQALPNLHGHVVVIVDGLLDRNKHPGAYWATRRRRAVRGCGA